jgi:hypothetical protein
MRPVTAQTTAQKKQLDCYVRQLQAKFQVWDLNRNTVLDKQELATAFRGAGAKPFDAQGLELSTCPPSGRNAGPDAVVLLSVPLPAAVNCALAEMLTWPRGPLGRLHQVPRF